MVGVYKCYRIYSRSLSEQYTFSQDIYYECISAIRDTECISTIGYTEFISSIEDTECKSAIEEKDYKRAIEDT